MNYHCDDDDDDDDDGSKMVLAMVAKSIEVNTRDHNVLLKALAGRIAGVHDVFVLGDNRLF